MRIILLTLLLLFSTSALTVVNINTASETELESLKGIGPARAKAIIEYRKAHGNFISIDSLDNVEGIGPGILKKIRPDVALEGKTMIATDIRSTKSLVPTPLAIAQVKTKSTPTPPAPISKAQANCAFSNSPPTTPKPIIKLASNTVLTKNQTPSVMPKPTLAQSSTSNPSTFPASIQAKNKVLKPSQNKVDQKSLANKKSAAKKLPPPSDIVR